MRQSSYYEKGIINSFIAFDGANFLCSRLVKLMNRGRLDEEV